MFMHFSDAGWRRKRKREITTMRKVIDQWTVFIYIFSVEMGKQMNVNNKNDSAHRKYTKKPNELVVAFNFLTPD